MFIVNSTNNTNENDLIISYEPPVKYDTDKKIKISYEITDLDEICNFYREHNKMSTGNITLLPRSELELYLSYDHIAVLMRSMNDKLMGIVISILLPIKNRTKFDHDNKNLSDLGQKIITHGCTTFLVVHSSIRGHGMCMALIRGLINRGYEKGLYCDYHTVPFKLGENSISLQSYYRPINLSRSLELGFLYPDCYDIRMKTKNKILFNTKLPKNYSYEPADVKSLEYYMEIIKNKKFVFYPDETMWLKWISDFPTYLIYYNNVLSGIVSINTIYCIISSTGKEGKVATPVLCNGNIDIILKVLPNIVQDYDVLYFHVYGDVTETSLESNHYIKTEHLSWFSLYNNRILLSKEEISVPLL